MYPDLASISLGQTDPLELSVSFEGGGLPNANVTWHASAGTVTPSQTVTDASGKTTAEFVPSGTGVVKITANVFHPALGNENLTASVEVTTPPPKQQPSIVDEVLTPAPFVHVPYVAFAGVAVVLLLVVFLLRRRRGGGKVEEVVGEGFDETSIS
jgi:hypothetical protein